MTRKEIVDQVSGCCNLITGSTADPVMQCTSTKRAIGPNFCAGINSLFMMRLNYQLFGGASPDGRDVLMF
jgi:hypothetical protein